jgi:hypothetical protein
MKQVPFDGSVDEHVGVDSLAVFQRDRVNDRFLFLNAVLFTDPDSSNQADVLLPCQERFDHLRGDVGFIPGMPAGIVKSLWVLV